MHFNFQGKNLSLKYILHFSKIWTEMGLDFDNFYSEFFKPTDWIWGDWENLKVQIDRINN